MNDWRADEARNEARRRVQNEWTREAAGSFAQTFVCECGDPDCTATIELTPAEDECVRSRSTWFALARNHENPEAEVLLGEHPGYTLVSKIAGPAMRIAVTSDPRRPLTKPDADPPDRADGIRE
jgi:hypothetical protein